MKEEDEDEDKNELSFHICVWITFYNPLGGVSRLSVVRHCLLKVGVEGLIQSHCTCDLRLERAPDRCIFTYFSL